MEKREGGGKRRPEEMSEIHVYRNLFKTFLSPFLKTLTKYLGLFSFAALIRI